MRKEVIAFAHYMEQELVANDHKGGWRGDFPSALLSRLREETEELDSALEGSTNCHCREAVCPHWSTVNTAQVVKEAADVANFAMMIADVVAPLSDLGSLATPLRATDPAVKRCRFSDNDLGAICEFSHLPDVRAMAIELLTRRKVAAPKERPDA